MLNRFLRRTGRLTAKALAAANLPRPPRRPETLTPGGKTAPAFVPVGTASRSALPPSMAVGDWEYLKAHLRWYIRRGMRKAGVPALSIALVDDQQLVWAEGFGFADLENQVAVKPDTRFRIGTASKAITSAALGLLMEKGRLDLDKEIQTYVPEFPKKEWPVT
ncbi:MAG: serine hydrolase domain-containing protein, partial [Pseudomonadota bacterium]